MKCTEMGSISYVMRKNKKKNPDALELMKYNPQVRRHTKYKETKK